MSSVRRGGAEVEVLPDRGALVSRLAVGGVDVLYLDAATLESPTRAVRGGIPLLFPFAGELQDGRLLATGAAMPRHGFGRRKAWQVIESAADSISMRLRPDAETHAPFPIEWEATQTEASVVGLRSCLSGGRSAAALYNEAPRPFARSAGRFEAELR